MKIYTAQTGDIAKIEKLQQYGVGCMISSTRRWRMTSRGLKQIPFFALDNGAFAAWQKGYPFLEHDFLYTLSKCHEQGIALDFIVCPDICGGRGSESLAFSLKWAERIPCENLALVVSSPLEPTDISFTLWQFSAVFIGGGDEDWQWSTAPDWIEFAHNRGRRCHIGMCNTLAKLRLAADLGADSVDSTVFVRNGRWDMLEEFARPVARQAVLF